VLNGPSPHGQHKLWGAHSCKDRFHDFVRVQR
jgi:hypothetical protein